MDFQRLGGPKNENVDLKYDVLLIEETVPLFLI